MISHNVSGKPVFLEMWGTDKRVMADAIGKAIADRIIADDTFAYENEWTHAMVGVIFPEGK